MQSKKEYNNYFHRQIQLWGEQTQESLQTKTIVIIGAGGLGSSIAFSLGASGIGNIHVVDFDEINTHNIHRQIAFKIGDEGKNKAEINVEVIKQRCPFTNAIAHKCDFLQWCEKNIKVDLIIDATDNLKTRADINEYAKKTTTPWVYGSVEAFHGQVAFIDKASFLDIFKIQDNKPDGVATPIVLHVASLQSNLALRFLANLSVKKDLLYYLFFNKDGELITQKFNLPT